MVLQTNNDEVFFNRVRLHLHKTLTPSRVMVLREVATYTFTDLLTTLQNFEASSCVARELSAETPLSRRGIYSRLLKCWERVLRDEIRLIKPSDCMKDVFDLYVSRYVLNDLTGILSAGVEETTYLSAQAAEALREAAEVDGLLSTLAGSGLNAGFIVDVLEKYRGFRVSELDVRKLVEELNSSFFRRLKGVLSASGASSRGLGCVDSLEGFEGVKYAVRRSIGEGGDFRGALTRLTPSQREALIKHSSDPHTLEFLLVTLPVNSCHSVLRSMPPSTDTFLHYLTVKEWEFQALSYVFYLMYIGYPTDMIRDEVGRWLRLYESLPK